MPPSEILSSFALCPSSFSHAASYDCKARGMSLAENLINAWLEEQTEHTKPRHLDLVQLNIATHTLYRLTVVQKNLLAIKPQLAKADMSAEALAEAEALEKAAAKEKAQASAKANAATPSKAGTSNNSNTITDPGFTNEFLRAVRAVEDHSDPDALIKYNASLASKHPYHNIETEDFDDDDFDMEDCEDENFAPDSTEDTKNIDGTDSAIDDKINEIDEVATDFAKAGHAIAEVGYDIAANNSAIHGNPVNSPAPDSSAPSVSNIVPPSVTKSVPESVSPSVPSSFALSPLSISSSTPSIESISST